MDNRLRRSQNEEMVRLDGEGNWFQGEYPILHERTVQFLHKNIQRDENGRYYLTGEDKPMYFTVEDVPYFVTKVEKTIAGFLITLTDESIELLDLNHLWVGPKDALYCLVKGGGTPAKFFRNAYYDITNYLVKSGKRYCLVFGNKKYPIDDKPPKKLLEVQKKEKKAHAKLKAQQKKKKSLTKKKRAKKQKRKRKIIKKKKKRSL